MGSKLYRCVFVMEMKTGDPVLLSLFNNSNVTCNSANANQAWPRSYKTFCMFNSAEHEIFSANKYKNANNNWHFYIYKHRNIYALLCLARKNLQLLVF